MCDVRARAAGRDREASRTRVGVTRRAVIVRRVEDSARRRLLILFLIVDRGIEDALATGDTSPLASPTYTSAEALASE